MKALTIIVKVSQALVKPLTKLLKDLEDGKISREERDELLMSLALTVVELLGDLLPGAE